MSATFYLAFHLALCQQKRQIKWLLHPREIAQMEKSICNETQDLKDAMATEEKETQS